MADEAAQAAEVRRLLGIRGGKAADPFAVLQLSVEACEVGDVNKSFRRIALLLHPDKCKLPHATDAFHVAERAHKILSQEAVLAHLKRAHEKRRAQTADSSSSSSNSRGGSSVTSQVPHDAACAFGALSKLAADGLSSDAQKAAEIHRLLQCSATDYFVILDVDPSKSDVADVDRRYRRMAQALHPDKCQLPKVAEAFTVFERAHKALADAARLARHKAAYMQQQQRKRDEQKQTAMGGGSGGTALDGGGPCATAADQLQQRKRDALREQQLEAARLAEEAVRKKRKVEGEAAERAELAAELERQRREWRDLQLY